MFHMYHLSADSSNSSFIPNFNFKVNFEGRYIEEEYNKNDEWSRVQALYT